MPIVYVTICVPSWSDSSLFQSLAEKSYNTCNPAGQVSNLGLTSNYGSAYVMCSYTMLSSCSGLQLFLCQDKKACSYLCSEGETLDYCG